MEAKKAEQMSRIAQVKYLMTKLQEKGTLYEVIYLIIVYGAPMWTTAALGFESIVSLRNHKETDCFSCRTAAAVTLQVITGTIPRDILNQETDT